MRLTAAAAAVVFLFLLLAAEGEATAGPTQLWKHTFPDGAIARQPALSADGFTIYASEGSMLVAMDALNGTVVWVYATAGMDVASPVVVGHTVYFGSYDFNVYALDGQTGEKIWSLRTDGPLQGPPLAAEVEGKGLVLFVPGNSFFYALNATNGGLLWYASAPQSASFLIGPAFGDGTVFAPFTSGILALDARTGARVWNVSHLVNLDFQPTFDQGTLYVSAANEIIALDAHSGKTEWIFPCISAGFVTVANGIVYVGSNPSLFALDAVTGAQKWAFQATNYVYQRPLLLDGVVYFGSNGKKLYALDATTGAQRWATDIDGHYGGGVIRNGILYFGIWSEAAEMVALQLGGKKSDILEERCVDAKCQVGCAAIKAPTGCEPVGALGSILRSCHQNTLIVTTFGATNCTGQMVEKKQFVLNACYVDQFGGSSQILQCPT